MSMLGFTFITDSKLSMYREKAIKSENLAKEIEEMQDKAASYKERLSELKSDIASKDKEILSVGKDLSESKEKIDALKENQKKLIKQMFEGGVSATVQLEDWKKSLEIKELDRTLLALTVDKIYIYENKQIKIHIRYQDMIEKMKVIRRFYAEHRTECRKEVE